MATEVQAQESIASLSSQLLAEIRQNLLTGAEDDQPYHSHSQPTTHSTHTQQREGHSVGHVAPSSLPATISESVEQPVSAISEPLKATDKVQSYTVQAPSAVMELMAASISSQDALKGPRYAGNTHPDGDTQPMPSQVYHEERASMLRQSMAARNVDTGTPMKSMAAKDRVSWTGQSPMSGATVTPHTLQQDQSGYVNLAAGYRDSSPVRSTQGDEGFDELLQDPSSPQTQAPMPGRSFFPETPALAGQKHGRDGEMLTSVTTARTNNTNWGFSQAFGQQKAALMDGSQLFAQTQAASSPLPDALRSDPIHSRPSPNIKEGVDVSSPLLFPNSSPAYTRMLQPLKVPGEPRTRYKTMAEEQRDRLNVRACSAQAEATGSSVDDGFDNDSYQERVRIQGLRRTLSDQAMISAAKVKAPARPGAWHSLQPVSRSSSNYDQRTIIDIVTPGSGERLVCNLDDEFLGVPDVEDAVDEEQEDELPTLKPIHEDDYENQEDHDLDDRFDDDLEGGDVDEYDELSQALRSQANNPDDLYNDRSVAYSVEPEDTEMQDEVDKDEIGRYTHQSTQRSAIANSQPSAKPNRSQPMPLGRMQHSSLASFVPGSQYAGKTSEEQAYLAPSQRRSQSIVPASQVPIAASSLPDNLPSSPALPILSGVSPETVVAAVPAHRDVPERISTRSSLEQEGFGVNEIPESDLVEAEPDEPQHAAVETSSREEEIQDGNAPAPYSTARTHVSGSAQSPAKSTARASATNRAASQQSRGAENSPRKAAGVRRFGEMATGLTQSSMSFELGDVDDIMKAVITDDDRQVIGLNEVSLESPRPKRRRTVRGRQTQSELVPPEPYQGTGDVHLAGKGTRSEAERVLTESRSNSVAAEERPQILRDSPSKGNELSKLPAEGSKPLDPVFDDTQDCEREGANAVSQLVAARNAAPLKKARTTTYGRKSRKRSKIKATLGRSPNNAKSRVIEASEQGDNENPDADPATAGPRPKVRAVEDGAVSAASEHGEHVTDMVESVNQIPDAGANAHAVLSPNDKEHDVAETLSPMIAPKRVFALFKGVYQNFYPATWLGESANGMSYQVQFDDATVTEIEPFHVRSLDLRSGDLVKVDVAGMKTKVWRVVGFTPPVETPQENEVAVDIHGHAQVRIQAKQTRNSLAKEALPSAATDESQIEEVLISQVYLTKTMWPNFQARTFRQPLMLEGSLNRAATPSNGSTTPVVETPSSRSRRAKLHSVNTKALNGQTPHLRDLSIAPIKSPQNIAMFTGMAFAISYITSENAKVEVTRLIAQHGGTILHNGFEELFELPDIGEPPAVSSKKKSPEKADCERTIRGLHVKAEHKGLNFVALIADRHSRRAKYMQALALGLPTLSGRWIIDSLNTTKNAASADGERRPLSWDRFLLPAGECSYLGGAIRSRTLSPYDTRSSELADIIPARPMLLDGGSVLIVAPKKGKASWEKRKTYAFLTLALGASQVTRVNDLKEARDLIRDKSDGPKWVYVDGGVAHACTVLFDEASAGKKKKGSGEAVETKSYDTSATHGNVRVVSDEFVIQSLILGALTE